MDKMKETIKIVTMLCVVLFFYHCVGLINYYSPYYEAADPSEPSAVTINGRSASLLSDSNNLSNAFGYDYCKLVGCTFGGSVKLLDTTHGGITNFYKGDNYYYTYEFDPCGDYPDICSIYNGVTTASTREELESAFGDDCIKTNDYYAEIFVDNKEVDYESAGYTEDYYEWFKTTAKNYPDAEYITILECYYYSNDTPNHITFHVYNNINTE